MRPVGAELFHEDGWTDRQIDRQTETARRTESHDELTVAFCNFVNKHKHCKNGAFISRLHCSFVMFTSKVIKI